jgi:hypothetical protein
MQPAGYTAPSCDLTSPPPPGSAGNGRSVCGAVRLWRAGRKCKNSRWDKHCHHNGDQWFNDTDCNTATGCELRTV